MAGPVRDLLGVVIQTRVLGEALEGVDPAQTRLHVRRAKIVRGRGEAIRKLGLSGGFLRLLGGNHGLVSENKPDKDSQSAHDLAPSLSGLILELKLFVCSEILPWFGLLRS